MFKGGACLVKGRLALLEIAWILQQSDCLNEVFFVQGMLPSHSKRLFFWIGGLCVIGDVWFLNKQTFGRECLR